MGGDLFISPYIQKSQNIPAYMGYESLDEPHRIPTTKVPELDLYHTTH